uniref:Solute carrier family 12 member 9 n=1 Tax=Cyprinodon variegatus TaxID=28743 RepID=A0A3Q2DDT4_CYPVA
MPNERSPLITSGVCGLTLTTACGTASDSPQEPNAGKPAQDPRRLNTFFGVMVPTILSMFSIILFLRTGFVVGHAGLLQGLLMLVVAYTIISLTVLSICAISTNGAIQGGGAYYMISRSLGPEFGGSIGLMFFFAKVFACGEYVLGLVEAILDVFGADPGRLSPWWRVLPQGYWYTVLYSSVVLLLCLLVCLVGAHIYSRTAFAILLVVTVSLLSVFISTVAVKAKDFVIVHKGPGNQTLRYNASYTGFSATTLRNNLAGYSLDYSTNSVMSFATVFAVMFTSCTGIMAGANMSGYTKTAKEITAPCFAPSPGAYSCDERALTVKSSHKYAGVIYVCMVNSSQSNLLSGAAFGQKKKKKDYCQPLLPDRTKSLGRQGCCTSCDRSVISPSRIR